MTTPHRGLGRGLGSLIPARSEPDAAENAPAAAGTHAVGASFMELPLDSIAPNPRQPRTDFDEDALAELVASIEAVGLLQPIVVRATGAGGYQLVMGERRWRAARRAGLDPIPAIVKETTDDDLLRDALLENLHRADLNALEEAAAYAQLLDDFGCTHDDLAARLGRSRPHVTNTLRLLRLTPPVQRRVAAGVLSAGHARALLAVAEPSEQERLASKVVAEGLSVRGLEELVAVGETPSRRRTPRAPVRSPELDELADRLMERLDTNCRVERGRRRGRVIIEFATAEDLDRIARLLGLQ